MIKIELRVSYWMDRVSETITITDSDLQDLVQHKMKMKGIQCHVKKVTVERLEIETGE